MGTSLLGDGSDGTFTLSSGGGLSIGDPAGISTSGATGNIRVTGTRTFSTTADYTYNGSAAQILGNGLPATVRNFTLNNSNGITLQNTLAVSNTLTLTSGLITTGAFELNVTNTSAAAVTGHSTASYVIGNLRRSISSSGTYAFPIGTATQYELASTTLVGIGTTSSILATFTNINPLNVSNPLTSLLLNGAPVIDMLNYGYWTLTPNVPSTGGTFSFTANLRGYTNASGSNSYTVLSRDNSTSDWQTPGVAIRGSLTGGTVTSTRSGLTAFNDYGIGISENPIPMVFMNASLISGVDGEINAVYKFPNIASGLDAWITLVDKQGGASLSGIDNFSGGNGYDIAWQPFVNAVGNDTSSIGWLIQFKKAGTSTDTTLQNVAITGIDIDGTTSLREFVEATRPYSYSLATVTTLTMEELDSSYRATGDYAVISNIDTSRTEAMYQINYSSISAFYYRTGAISTKSSDEVRQHALMFNSTLSNNTTTTSALPVNLVYFTPIAKSTYVELNWATASEVNNDYFTIERSRDGKTFEEILRKKGAGSSTTIKKYLGMDNNPLPGYNYYRLKQTDFDGKFEYFPVKAVRFGSVKTEQGFSIKNTAPNPFTNTFTINYFVEKEGAVDIQLYSSSGQMVYTTAINAQEGVNIYTYEDTSGLPPGIYILKMTTNGEVVTTKVKKQ